MNGGHSEEWLPPPPYWAPLNDAGIIPPSVVYATEYHGCFVMHAYSWVIGYAPELRSPNRGSMGRDLDHASVMIHPRDMASPT